MARHTHLCALLSAIVLGRAFGHDFVGTQISTKVSRQFRHLSEEVQSVLQSVTPLPVETQRFTSQSRALSMDDGECAGVAFWGLLGSIFLSYGMLGTLTSNLEGLCAYVQMAAGSDESKSLCLAKKQNTTCNNGCEWKKEEDKCEEYGMKPLMNLISPDADSITYKVFDAMNSCNKFNKEDCAGDCEFSAKDFNCEVKFDHYKSFICAHPDGKEYFKLSCGSKTKDNCTGSCEWDLKEKRCDVTTAKQIELLYGTDSAAKWVPRATLMATCGENDGNNTCAADGCHKNKDKCEVKPDKVVADKLSEAEECKQISTEGTCPSPKCKWEEDKCDISLEYMQTFCSSKVGVASSALKASLPGASLALTLATLMRL